jgi:hypothetical protein
MRDFDARAEFVIGGTRYRWSGWFGCQLESLEWRTVPAGTERDLRLHMDKGPVSVTVYSTKREGLRVRTTWSVSKSGTHDEFAARIYDLQDQLRRLV